MLLLFYIVYILYTRILRFTAIQSPMPSIDGTTYRTLKYVFWNFDVALRHSSINIFFFLSFFASLSSSLLLFCFFHLFDDVACAYHVRSFMMFDMCVYVPHSNMRLHWKSADRACVCVCAARQNNERNSKAETKQHNQISFKCYMWRTTCMSSHSPIKWREKDIMWWCMDGWLCRRGAHMIIITYYICTQISQYSPFTKFMRLVGANVEPNQKKRERKKK